MATRQTAFRLDAELVERLDAYAQRLEEATPGLKVTRADAVRMLLLDGLARAEKSLPKKRR